MFKDHCSSLLTQYFQKISGFRIPSCQLETRNQLELIQVGREVTDGYEGAHIIVGQAGGQDPEVT